jgi:transcription antitermination factor NusG
MTLEQDSAKHWYAFKVFYNKVFEIDKELKRMGGETYFPIVRSFKLQENKKKQVIKPAISSLIFVRCFESDTVTYQNQLNGRVMLYSHVTDGVRKPSPIDEEEMRIFKLVTSVEDERLQYLDVESINYKEGQKVRVLDGPYAGCTGYVKRIKGNRRLLVAVEGLALVATSYIPSVFLEKI